MFTNKPIRSFFLSTTTLAFAGLALAGCAGAASSESGQSDIAAESTSSTPAVSYVDVEEYTIDQGDASFDTWRAIYGTLAANFDDVCGDTFCEGDYSNIVPIRLRCTINPANAVLKNCTYVFAGSYEDITPSTGTIRVNAKTFSCHIPVSGIKLSDFVSTLTATGNSKPLQRPLANGKSIYDSLVGCI